MQYELRYSEKHHLYTIFDIFNNEPVEDYQNAKQAYRECNKLNSRQRYKVRYSIKLEIYTIWCTWDCEPIEDYKDANQAYQRCEELGER
jgi:hypothetical protein